MNGVGARVRVQQVSDKLRQCICVNDDRGDSARAIQGASNIKQIICGGNTELCTFVFTDEVLDEPWDICVG